MNNRIVRFNEISIGGVFGYFDVRSWKLLDYHQERVVHQIVLDQKVAVRFDHGPDAGCFFGSEV